MKFRVFTKFWNFLFYKICFIFFWKFPKVMKQQRAGDDAMSHEERMGEVAEKFSAKKSMKKISKPWKSHLFRCLLNSFSQFSEQFQNLFQDFANKYLSKMSSTFVFNFCSSKNVLILDDGEMAVITQNSWKLSDFQGQEITREPRTITWSRVMAEKEG